MNFRIIFSLILLTFSITYFLLSLKLEFLSNNIPGNGFLPGIVGISLIILTGLNLMSELKNKETTVYSKSNLIDMIKIALIILGYILFFHILGAVLSTFLFILSVLFIINRQKKIQNFAFSIIVTLVVYVAFDVLLNTHLPLGIFE